MENRHKRRMVEMNNGTVFGAFGNYVALSEFDKQTSHIAQNELLPSMGRALLPTEMTFKSNLPLFNTAYMWIVH